MTFHHYSDRKARGSMARDGNAVANKSPRLSVCLPAQLFETLSSVAIERRVPMSQVIREICEGRRRPLTGEVVS